MPSDSRPWEPLLSELAELWGHIANLRRETSGGGVSKAEPGASRPSAEREARLETLIENMPVMLGAFDEAGVIVAWNHEAERVTGYTAKELIGNPRAMEWLYPESSHRTNMIREWEKRRNNCCDWEWELTAKDGTARRISWSDLSDRFPIPGWKTWGIGIDVTERERALTHLRALTERTRRILETTQDGYILGDSEGTIIDVNPAYCKMMGYAREELLGRNVHELEAHLTPEAVLEVAREVLGKGTHRIQTHHRHRDGALIDLDVSFTAFFAGTTPLVAAFARDITDIKRSEQTLKRMNRALQTYSECNSALVHATDEQSFLERTCKILTEAGGYELAWVGFARDDGPRTVDIVAASGNDAGYLANLEKSWVDDDYGRGPAGRAIRSGKVQVVQDLASDPGYGPWREKAQQRGFRAAISLPLTAENRVFGALNAYSNQPRAFDAAEVKLLSDLAADLAFGLLRLRERQQQRSTSSTLRKLSAAVEQSPQMVMITDAEGTIEYVNTAFTTLTGFNTREAIGQKASLLRSGQTPKATYEDLWHTILSGKRWRGEICSRKKDGNTYWESASIFPIRDESGKITHFIGMMDDISERKRLEQEQRQLEAQLHHAQKMKTIGTLAGGIAHDFNNLLQAIIGYADLALAALPPNEQAREEIGQVLAAAGRAKKLVQQILTFGRRAETRRQTVELHPIIKDALDLLRAAVPATIEIRFVLAEDCGPVLADPDQIHQVLMNICTNACQAMSSRGGILEVKLGRAKTEEERSCWPVPLPDGSWVCISIRDTGPGIENETLQRIFDPFFTTKIVGQGTGLGLSVAHGIVTAHGGHIEVVSRLGEGTTFFVCLPASGRAAAEDRSTPPGTPAGDERLLYVDDEEQVAVLVKKMLEHLGYTVTTCTDSEDALSLFRSNPAAFDMVITDQIMPRLSGTDLARQMRSSREDLPIILLTGFGDLLPQKALTECGIETHLLKPVTAFDLGRAVRAILDRRAPH